MFSRIFLVAGVACVALWADVTSANDPHEKYERKSSREWKYEYQNGTQVIKEERKGLEYKYEEKTRRGERKYEAKADGSWKEEVKAGGCTIKRERTSSGEYKEDRSC